VVPRVSSLSLLLSACSTAFLCLSTLSCTSRLQSSMGRQVPVSNILCRFLTSLCLSTLGLSFIIFEGDLTFSSPVLLGVYWCVFVECKGRQSHAG